MMQVAAQSTRAVTRYSHDQGNDTTTFGYDNNGNTTSMTQPGPIVTTYGYDYENRLTSVAKPGYSAAYTYTADGLRLRAQESNNPNPDRWFQYDGVRPVLESVLNGDSMTVFAKYVWEGNSYYDPLVLALEGGAWRDPLYDGLGSTRQVATASSWSITDIYSYEAFGNLLASTGTTPNPYRYVGELGYYQTGSSLISLPARYYAAELGRFGARDPLYSYSHYSYVGNGPANAVDPTGLFEGPPNKRVPPTEQSKADKAQADVMFWCSGINPQSHNTVNACSECCNALTNNIQTLLGYAGYWLTVPPLPTATLATLHVDCGRYCCARSSGAQTVRWYLREAANGAAHNVADTIALELLKWLLFHG